MGICKRKSKAVTTEAVKDVVTYTATDDEKLDLEEEHWYHQLTYPTDFWPVCEPRESVSNESVRLNMDRCDYGLLADTDDVTKLTKNLGEGALTRVNSVQIGEEYTDEQVRIYKEGLKKNARKAAKPRRKETVQMHIGTPVKKAWVKQAQPEAGAGSLLGGEAPAAPLSDLWETAIQQTGGTLPDVKKPAVGATVDTAASKKKKGGGLFSRFRKSKETDQPAASTPKAAAPIPPAAGPSTADKNREQILKDLMNNRPSQEPVKPVKGDLKAAEAKKASTPATFDMKDRDKILKELMNRR